MVAVPKVRVLLFKVNAFRVTVAPVVRVALPVKARLVVLVVSVPVPILKLPPRLRVVLVTSTVPAPVLVKVPFINRVPLTSTVLAADRARVPVTVRTPPVPRVPVPAMVSASPVGISNALVTVRVWAAKISRLALLVRARVVMVALVLISIVLPSSPLTETLLMVLAPETSSVLAALFRVRGFELLIAPTSDISRVKAPILVAAPE